MSQSHYLPRSIIHKIVDLAEPYGTFPKNAEVKLSEPYLHQLDQILKKLRKKATGIYGKFFSSWKIKVVQFNMKFEAALNQLKKDRNLVAMQNLNFIIQNEMPKDLLGYEDYEESKCLRELDDEINAKLVIPMQEKMLNEAENEVEAALALEYKKLNYTDNYLELVKQEQEAAQELDRLLNTLNYYYTHEDISIEDFVANYNSDEYLEGPTLTLYKKSVSTWLDEEDDYENHEENFAALEKYNEYIEYIKDGIESYEEHVKQAKTTLEFIRRQKDKYAFEHKIDAGKDKVVLKLIEAKDPWQKLKIFLGADVDQFVRMVCKKMESKFKLASIKKLTPETSPSAPEQETTPSAPLLYPLLTIVFEDDEQPGLKV